MDADSMLSVLHYDWSSPIRYSC